VDHDAIRSLLTRLARAHPSGGTVIERAAVLAEGADFDAVMAWIVARTAENPRRPCRRHRDQACTARVFTTAGARNRGPRRASCSRPARCAERTPNASARAVRAEHVRGAGPQSAPGNARRARSRRGDDPVAVSSRGCASAASARPAGARASGESGPSRAAGLARGSGRGTWTSAPHPGPRLRLVQERVHRGRNPSEPSKGVTETGARRPRSGRFSAGDPTLNPRLGPAGIDHGLKLDAPPRDHASAAFGLQG
jgi:hypothetical protein